VADEAPSRRGRLTIRAHDPETGGEIEVYVSYERLQAIAKRSRGQVMEAAEQVPQVLQQHGPEWEGLRNDEDEDRQAGGVGWRCYCGVPDRSYTPDGDRCPPRRGGVFLVFVNEDRVAYNWRWEPADPDDRNLPRGHQTRFRRRLA
jgi:hypothetical protein